MSKGAILLTVVAPTGATLLPALRQYKRYH